MCICKVQKTCINWTWIAWLIHGFLSGKTWLLIACDTAFYAIIPVNLGFQNRLVFNWAMPSLTLCLLVSSADNLCKQFGPRSGRQNVGPDLDQNCLTLWWYSWKNFSEKMILKKINRWLNTWIITLHANIRVKSANCKVNLWLYVGDWTCVILFVGLCDIQ